MLQMTNCLFCYFTLFVLPFHVSTVLKRCSSCRFTVYKYYSYHDNRERFDGPGAFFLSVDGERYVYRDPESENLQFLEQFGSTTVEVRNLFERKGAEKDTFFTTGLRGSTKDKAQSLSLVNTLDLMEQNCLCFASTKMILILPNKLRVPKIDSQSNRFTQGLDTVFEDRKQNMCVVMWKGNVLPSVTQKLTLTLVFLTGVPANWAKRHRRELPEKARKDPRV